MKEQRAAPPAGRSRRTPAPAGRSRPDRLPQRREALQDERRLHDLPRRRRLERRSPRRSAWPARPRATLTFYNKYKTESGYDFFRVEVSTNGGTSWTQIRSVSGTSSGYPSWAAQVSLSLNAYAGQSNVKVRFRFTSDSTIADWGVAFDDVVVTAQ